MKKFVIFVIAISTLLPLSSQAGQCKLSIDSDGDMILSAGNGQSLEIDIQRTKDNLRVLLQICNEVHAATHCRGYTLPKDEWQRQEGDPKPIYVNMGRERAELIIGALPSWIAQFATKNYNRDQWGIYHSVSACESNRARIASEVAERAHDVIEDGEEAAAAQRRQEQILDNPYWGPKY